MTVEYISRKLPCPDCNAEFIVETPTGIRRVGQEMDFCPVFARRFVSALAGAAVAVGADALFLELHPDPEKALRDGPNSLDFKGFEQLVAEVVAIRRALEACAQSGEG